jgi:cation diffusion facilitator family transporter
MSRFPDPISLPDSIPSERATRRAHLIKSAQFGISIRLIIIIIELFAVTLFNSSALLMDALSSLLDVASTFFLILCIQLASRPPDDDHPFGHGRYEPIAGLQLALLLAIFGGGMFIQQIFQVTTQTSSDQIIDSRTWIIPFCATILLEICYHIMMKTASKQHSSALAADAFHYRIDALNSLCATIVLLGGAFIPQWSSLLDHIGALLISLFMIFIGLYAARNNLHQLMDRTPDRLFFEKVRKAVQQVQGILGTEKIRIQVYGPDAHVDIDIEVDPQMSVEVAHQISQKARVEIQKEWPSVRDVIVHVEPYYAGDH